MVELGHWSQKELCFVYLFIILAQALTNLRGTSYMSLRLDVFYKMGTLSHYMLVVKISWDNVFKCSELCLIHHRTYSIVGIVTIIEWNVTLQGIQLKIFPSDICLYLHLMAFPAEPFKRNSDLGNKCNPSSFSKHLYYLSHLLLCFILYLRPFSLPVFQGLNTNAEIILL